MLRRVCLVAAKIACGWLLTGAAFAEDARDLLKQGASLAAEEVTALEGQLEKDPLDMSARAQLLGYYGDVSRYRQPVAKSRSRALVLWLIKNEPKSGLLAALSPHVREPPFDDPEWYVDGKRAYLAHLEEEPNNLALLGLAADFLSHGDRALTIELLQRAQSLDESNALWARRLGLRHYFNSLRGSEESRVESAKKSVEQYVRMLELTEGNPYGGSLQYGSKAALVARDYERARDFAEVMLRQEPSGWDYASNIHYGNITLGRVALSEGNVKQARSFLLRAGAALESPKLRLIAPDTILAKELLERGERKVVLRYLDQCATFWERGRDVLEEWKVLVRAGRTPVSSSFRFGR
ncbi:MAG: hypothetical protein OXJ37_21465 [Bryobacterales bacterium]|nr:hypothetical protein [Bryobacterales bacterium]MDE0264987.1 hypothetical protein [Bryobacterales bacterium]MDE0620062.1 hypothetical protein [Bryobacterales bacterium]